METCSNVQLFTHIQCLIYNKKPLWSSGCGRYCLTTTLTSILWVCTSMDNPEKLATLGTQATGQRQTK
jgi:hypothetical protein